MTNTLANRFRQLHHQDTPLLLANAWDAASARLIESCGAAAIATTSAGLAWSRGYPDGNAMPPRVAAAATEAIARVLSVPLTVDVEAGYSDDPQAAGEIVAAVVAAGAVGINLEDGAAPPDLLCAKIARAKTIAAKAGVDLFVNARTDVYLRALVPADKALAETIARAHRYREAGCDGVFVPALRVPDEIRAIVAALGVPLNVMVIPTLPPVAELARLGVKRVSAGSALAQAAFGFARDAARRFLDEGRYEAMFGPSATTYADMNALFASRPN